MSNIKDSIDGKLWSRLTKEEQEDLLQSDIEAEDPKNLISNSIIQKKTRLCIQIQNILIEMFGGNTHTIKLAFQNFVMYKY